MSSSNSVAEYKLIYLIMHNKKNVTGTQNFYMSTLSTPYRTEGSGTKMIAGNKDISGQDLQQEVSLVSMALLASMNRHFLCLLHVY